MTAQRDDRAAGDLRRANEHLLAQRRPDRLERGASRRSKQAHALSGDQQLIAGNQWISSDPQGRANFFQADFLDANVGLGNFLEAARRIGCTLIGQHFALIGCHQQLAGEHNRRCEDLASQLDVLDDLLRQAARVERDDVQRAGRAAAAGGDHEMLGK